MYRPIHLFCFFLAFSKLINKCNTSYKHVYIKYSNIFCFSYLKPELTAWLHFHWFRWLSILYSCPIICEPCSPLPELGGVWCLVNANVHANPSHINVIYVCSVSFKVYQTSVSAAHYNFISGFLCSFTRLTCIMFAYLFVSLLVETFTPRYRCFCNSSFTTLIFCFL